MFKSVKKFVKKFLGCDARKPRSKSLGFDDLEARLTPAGGELRWETLDTSHSESSQRLRYSHVRTAGIEITQTVDHRVTVDSTLHIGLWDFSWAYGDGNTSLNTSWAQQKSDDVISQTSINLPNGAGYSVFVDNYTRTLASTDSQEATWSWGQTRNGQSVVSGSYTSVVTWDGKGNSTNTWYTKETQRVITGGLSIYSGPEINGALIIADTSFKNEVLTMSGQSRTTADGKTVMTTQETQKGSFVIGNRISQVGNDGQWSLFNQTISADFTESMRTSQYYDQGFRAYSATSVQQTSSREMITIQHDQRDSRGIVTHINSTKVLVWVGSRGWGYDRHVDGSTSWWNWSGTKVNSGMTVQISCTDSLGRTASAAANTIFAGVLATTNSFDVSADGVSSNNKSSEQRSGRYNVVKRNSGSPALRSAIDAAMSNSLRDPYTDFYNDPFNLAQAIYVNGLWGPRG